VTKPHTNCLRRINSQLTSIAYNIVRDSTQSGKTPIHGSGEGVEVEVEEAWPADESADRTHLGPGLERL
jgi:hypothetical protein